MGKKKSKKIIYRIIKYFFLFIIIILIGGYIYFNNNYPKTIQAPKVEIFPTVQRIERGNYLVNHVTVCLSCHSTRDWTKFSGPVIPGTEGMGGEKFEDGLPGTIYAGNITPSGIGEWTNGEVLRAITTGVTKDNRVLFPLMPYLEYHNLKLEDLYSIIAYLRTLQPIVNEVPQSSINFPMNLIVKTFPPKSYDPINSIDESNSVEYGKYLVTIADCKNCHTPMKEGKLDDELTFAGGTEFRIKGGIVRSVNITPDIETGIGRWTRKDFLNQFEQYSDKDATITPGEFNTPMPWNSYAGMADKDLNAIYDYLKTVPPIHHKVDRFTSKKQN